MDTSELSCASSMGPIRPKQILWRRVSIKRLRHTLNMGFAEISVYNGLCKNVSSIHGWGKGQVEFPICHMCDWDWSDKHSKDSL